jgi:uncharacterized protein YecT (DUF1311 family)
MIECMGAETKRQDVPLNKAYKVIMAGLSSERKKQLQEAQPLWLKYRQANCDFYYNPDGGTIDRVNANHVLCPLQLCELKSWKVLNNHEVIG